MDPWAQALGQQAAADQVAAAATLFARQVAAYWRQLRAESVPAALAARLVEDYQRYYLWAALRGAPPGEGG